MKYVSIDIETTGLNPSTCQILELGAVIDDTDPSLQKPISELASFHTYVSWDWIVGEPKALAMNAKIINRIADREPPWTYTPADNLTWVFRDWIVRSVGGDSIVCAGKNFGAFDLQFLLKLPRANFRFRHRSLDPAAYFIDPTDLVPPNLNTCLTRAGIQKETPHTAREDAYLVVELLRVGMLRLETSKLRI